MKEKTQKLLPDNNSDNNLSYDDADFGDMKLKNMDKNGLQPFGGNTTFINKKLIAAWIGIILHFYYQTFIYPIIPFLIQYIFAKYNNIIIHDQNVGYYSGLFGSLYYLGTYIGSTFVYSSFVRIIGMYNTLLLNSFVNLLFIMGFGLSTNVWEALAFRFVGSIFNGNLILSKIILIEISNDNNRSKLYSYIGIIGGIGRLIASLVSGFLYNNVKPDGNNFELYDTSGVFRSTTQIFVDFPQILPCLIYGIVSIIQFFYIIFAMASIKKKNKLLKRHNMSISKVYYHNIILYVYIAIYHIQTVTLYIYILKTYKVPSVNFTDINSQKNVANETILNIFKKFPTVLTSIVLTGLWTFLTSGFQELLPVWVATDENYWGFNYNVTEIGILFSISSISFIVYSKFINPCLLKRYQSLKITQMGIIIQFIGFIGIPCISIMRNDSNHILTIAILSFAIFISFVSRVAVGISMMTLVNYSAPREYKNRISNITAVSITIGNVIGPIFGTAILSLGMNYNESFPANFGIIFIIFALMTLILFIWVLLRYTKDIDKPYEQRIQAL